MMKKHKLKKKSTFKLRRESRVNLCEFKQYALIRNDFENERSQNKNGNGNHQTRAQQ